MAEHREKISESANLRLISANFDTKMFTDGFEVTRQIFTTVVSLIEWLFSHGHLDEIFSTFQVKAYGSIGEGLYYPVNILLDRDIDYVSIYPNTVAVENVRDAHQYTLENRIYLIENQMSIPGYCYLREINEGTVITPASNFLALIVENNGNKYISSSRAKEIFQTNVTPFNIHINANDMPNNVTRANHDGQLLTQGPALKLYNSAFCHIVENVFLNFTRTDLVFVIRCPNWPFTASEWVSRARKYGWPTKEQVREIVDQGIYLAPVGCKNHVLEGMQWRYSFNNAERQLVRSFNTTQAKCYVLLKRIVSENVTRQFREDIISSYHLKTLMFWTIEETDATAWIPTNLVHFIFLLLKRLVLCVNKLYCPSYFMPDENLFRNKVTADIKGQLVAILSGIIAEGWPVLTRLSNFAMDEKFIHSVCHEYKPEGYQAMQVILRSVDFSPIITRSSKASILPAYLEKLDKLELHDADSIHSAFGQMIHTLTLEVYACNDTHRKEMLKDFLATLCSIYGTHLMSFSRQANIDIKGIYGMEASGEMYTEIASWRNQADCLAKHANYAYMRGNFKSTFSTAYKLLQRYFRSPNEQLQAIFSANIIISEQAHMTAIDFNAFVDSLIFGNEVVFLRNEILAIPDDAKVEMFVVGDGMCHISLQPIFIECLVTDPYFYVSYLAFLAFHDLERYNEVDTVLQTMELICSVVPNSHLPVSLNLLGECYLKQGKIEKAMEKFVMSMKRSSRRNAAPWHVARIVWRKLSDI